MLRMKYLQIMTLKLLLCIASDIAESGYYSIMADESTDACNIEKRVICIHWLDKKMRVCEEYIGLIPVSQTRLMVSAMMGVRPLLEPKMFADALLLPLT